MNKKLAIVIPAYKIDFFELSLKSIVNQSCLDFNLYIGNDASNSDFETIINKYEGLITIIYKRFNYNLGGKDLVAHWERCIDMVSDEEWVWLFSDDDVMEKDCVLNFYEALNEAPDYDLFHFNVVQISNNNEILCIEPDFPQTFPISEFISKRLNRQIMSLVVEYIFRKERYFQCQQFQKFDLAWGSDDATWIKIGSDKGIRNIPKSKVKWRRSDVNISCNIEKSILMRKYNSRINFCLWLNDFIIKKEILPNDRKFKKRLKTWYLSYILNDLHLFSLKEIIFLINLYRCNVNKSLMLFETLDIIVHYFKQTLLACIKIQEK